MASRKITSYICTDYGFNPIIQPPLRS